MLDWLEWEPLDTDEAIRFAKKGLEAHEFEQLPELTLTSRVAALHFYKHLRLVWIRISALDGSSSDLFMLAGKNHHFVLDGTSTPIHDANDIEKLALTTASAPDYLRFFCFFVHGDSGPFPIIETLPKAPSPEAEAQPARLEVLRLLQPLAPLAQGSDGALRFGGTMIYSASLFRTVLSIAPDGQATMEEDEPLMADVPEEWRPELPKLYPGSAHLLFARSAGPTSPPKATRQTAPTPSVQTTILEKLVTLLLEQALSEQSGHRLIARFNATVMNQSPLTQFAELLVKASPIVVVESTIPFVEEVIARIVETHLKGSASPDFVRGISDGADDTRLSIAVPSHGPAVVLISLHAYRGLANVLRVSHELGSRNLAALIGCDRLGDVPASLREIVDVTLRLPPMSPKVYEALFLRVMGTNLPTGWQRPDSSWVGNILHTDLEHPSAFSLAPADAAVFVRERVMERLKTVDPAGGLSLSNLHGLGEARLFAEDLIAEIRAASAGQLPWSEVDRGVLLAGPPGTGKTTLARAIAKDCGIKFINASATSWQAVGHLGDHIRAIRADFTQARRFAPAILFIDEFDSIGNRELLSGHSAQYQTEVVNSVLEQMQGLDPSAPVIVIGATNSPDRVDPALRRAGRLDRTIEIPYPNSAALAAIFDHYLALLRTQGQLAADVNTTVLGQMCLRRTGADVELYVRGARRRARKAGRPLDQKDLLAEITGKARDPHAIPRMSADEIERVALHESGHAVARCLSSTKGADITFVSIVPRADGALGFVAFAPSEKQFVTRADYIEHIEIALAGRAAEEIRFGADGISAARTTICFRPRGWPSTWSAVSGSGPRVRWPGRKPSGPRTRSRWRSC
jgi:DNA polymerase III delta prime subunit